MEGHPKLNSCLRPVPGLGWSYQLGTGNTTYQWTPVLIDDGGTATYRSVVCGESHTCALRSDGQAVCFGANYYRQCGDGTDTEAVTRPTVVAGGIAFKRIAAGRTHTCALRASDGQTMCWGESAVRLIVFQMTGRVQIGEE